MSDVTHISETMLPAMLQKSPKKPQAEDSLDPYELVRRLSIIQAEETVRELERRRADWENELLESRGIRQTQVRNRIQTASNGPPHRQHRRSASIALAPDHLPPPAYTDVPGPARKHSLPSSHRPQYATGSRRPSLRRGDSADLATINENAVIEPNMENLFPEWTEKERRRLSNLTIVNEGCAPRAASALWKPRRRSSLVLQKESRQQNVPQSDSNPIPSRRSSTLQAQKEHQRQDWSQSDESPKSRKSSLLDKVEQYWKPSQVDASDGDAFSSKASTLRNSWRSSMGDSISSRKSSLLKKVGNYWVVSPPSSDQQPSVKDIHTLEDGRVVDSAGTKKKSGLFSKFSR
ncbi:hypothetical protein N0V82_000788 [Gnomoniopsis sp. IMI 355080]|nr:hypothetical protein N0V82_000788 [Gnomoniopsis sp. IMI 355080]